MSTGHDGTLAPVAIDPAERGPHHGRDATRRRRRPSPRALRRFGLVVVAWTAFGLLLAAQTQLQLTVRAQERALWSVLGPALVGSWIWALYTPGLAALTRWLRRLRDGSARWRGWAAYVAAHLATMAVVAVVDAAVWASVRPLIDGVALAWSAAFAGTLLVNVASYVAVTTLTEAADYAALYRERDRAAAELARTAAELQDRLEQARLRALDAQLRPHFLYNTLNVIAELVHEDPEAADEMLTRLGLLLRRSCEPGPHLVPLEHELEFVGAYAGILARRYGGRVALALDVPSALRDCLVPAYVLQPLVENAFRHGVERREEASAVEITASSRDGAVVLRVRDRPVVARGGAAPGGATAREPSDAWLGERDEPASRTGIGLRNTRERLEALYGAAAGLTLLRAGQQTTSVVWVPLRRAEGVAHAPVAAAGEAPVAGRAYADG